MKFINNTIINRNIFPMLLFCKVENTSWHILIYSYFLKASHLWAVYLLDSDSLSDFELEVNGKR